MSNVEAQAVQMRRPADARPGDSQASPMGGPNDVVGTAESAGAEIWGPLSHKWPAPICHRPGMSFPLMGLSFPGWVC